MAREAARVGRRARVRLWDGRTSLPRGCYLQEFIDGLHRVRSSSSPPAAARCRSACHVSSSATRAFGASGYRVLRQHSDAAPEDDAPEFACRGRRAGTARWPRTNSVSSASTASTSSPATESLCDRGQPALVRVDGARRARVWLLGVRGARCGVRLGHAAGVRSRSGTARRRRRRQSRGLCAERRRHRRHGIVAQRTAATCATFRGPENKFPQARPFALSLPPAAMPQRAMTRSFSAPRASTPSWTRGTLDACVCSCANRAPADQCRRCPGPGPRSTGSHDAVVPSSWMLMYDGVLFATYSRQTGLRGGRRIHLDRLGDGHGVAPGRTWPADADRDAESRSRDDRAARISRAVPDRRDIRVHPARRSSAPARLPDAGVASRGAFR